MSKRMKLPQIDPNAYNAMMALEKYFETATLSKAHRELIKIRASQINGCAYCIDMHTHDARKMGETEQRIYALSAWWETPFFTDEEQAILKLTEEMTLITQRVSDATYERAIAVLGEKYTAEVMMAVVAINAWNRIGVATALQPVKR